MHFQAFGRFVQVEHLATFVGVQRIEVGTPCIYKDLVVGRERSGDLAQVRL